MTTPREKLVKTGAKIARDGRYVTFQLAEVAIPKSLFAEILRLINRLTAGPAKRREEDFGSVSDRQEPTPPSEESEA